MSGVKVGGGPVLAASALIVKDENAYPIVDCNPAQGTKHRLYKEHRKALLRKYCRGWADNKCFAPIQWFSSTRLSPFLLRHSVDSNERR